MKIGDRVRIINNQRSGICGTIVEVKWLASSCAGISFRDSIKIVEDDGTVSSWSEKNLELVNE